MLVLCWIKSRQRSDFSHNRATPYFGLIQLRDRLHSSDFLLRCMTEARRSIRGTYVIALTVQCGRIMDGKEYIQDLVIGDYFGIKGNLNDLSTRLAISARISCRPPGRCGPHGWECMVCERGSLSLVRYKSNDYLVPVEYDHREVLVRGYVHEVVVIGADNVI